MTMTVNLKNGLKKSLPLLLLKG